VLYELLTGELPKGNLQPPFRKAPIDVRLGEVVLRALDERPEYRFQTAADFGTVIQAAAMNNAQLPNREDRPTMTTDNRTTSPKPIRRRPIAVALAIGVGIVLTLAAILAVAVFAYLRLRSRQAPIANVPTDAQVDPARANWSPATFSVHAADGLYQTSESSWSVKGGRAFMQVRRKEDDSLELRFVYPFDDFLPKETITMLHTRWGVAQVEQLAGSLNITQEQLTELKAVSPGTDILVAAADRQTLRTLFDDWISTSDKAKAEKALIEAVAQLDASYYEPTRQRIEGIAAQVKGIFNEDQLAGLTERFTPRPIKF
jgi:hypothetical protein